MPAANMERDGSTFTSTSPSGPGVRISTVAIDAHRKARVCRHGAVALNDGADKMVQRRPQVVNAITHDGAPMRRWLPEEINAMDALSHSRIILTRNSIWLAGDVPADLGFQL